MENREQPFITPTPALQKAEEEQIDKKESVVSENGSQTDTLGKFKSVQALMDAYKCLQSEFTKKCQALNELKKDKIEEKNEIAENINVELAGYERVEEKEASQNLTDAFENSLQENESETFFEISSENGQVDNKNLSKKNNIFSEEGLSQFLLEHGEAEEYAEEIKEKIFSSSQTSPYEVAWANILVGKLKENDGDKIINQYVLSNENVKNKIIESYLKELSETQIPKVLSSQGGERVSGVIPEAPKTLKDAKVLVNKMFS